MKNDTANAVGDWAALDIRALGRLMTAIEERTPEGRRSITALQAREWPGITVGITGPPGCGKSTLVAALIRELRRRDEAVGVLAVDPSSRRTGGALLGDRVRMMDFATDSRVLIRSLGTRGNPGGLAPSVADLARLLRAAGYAWTLVETVGVGQGEIEIAAQADVTLVVQAPGGGDDIQAMKKGLLEVADLWVVNKADLPGSDQLALDLTAWTADAPEKICRTNALSGEGVAALVDLISQRRGAISSAPARPEIRAEEIRREALILFAAHLDRRLREQPLPPGDSWQAAEHIVAEIVSGFATRTLK
jgi:LAO/AO transport system kinase